MKKSHLPLCFILISIYTNSLLSSGADELPPVFDIEGHHTNSLVSSGADERPPVLDTDGNELQAGTNYYIISAIFGAGGGGLTLASTGNKTCPLSVVQEQSDLQRGLPFIFRPVNSSEGVVRLSTDQNIIFDGATICAQSTVWKVALDESIGQYVVTTGGVEGNPGRETISNWFKIVEAQLERTYRLLYCPSVCDTCKVRCQFLGIFIQDWQRRLALTDDTFPFMVVFRKADE